MLGAVAWICLGATVSIGAIAQSQHSQVHRVSAAKPGWDDTSVFAPLDLTPAANEFRSATGAPGSKYWQNRADYAIEVTLDTTQHTLYGRMTLSYTNHSPDTLTTILYEAGSFTIDTLIQNVGGQPHPLQYVGQQYTTRINLAEPLAPGQTAKLDFKWHASADQQLGLYTFRHAWYPVVVVYDGVQKWSDVPYYNEYGDVGIKFTVPAGYVVASAGTLDNPRDVLTAAQYTRLVAAKTADTVVHVIAANEAAASVTGQTATGTRTWMFHSTRINVASWSAAPDYAWDATSWHGVLVQALYRPSHLDKLGQTSWADAATMAHLSIQEYSERWLPYPYPQISIVASAGQGASTTPMISMLPEEPRKANTSLFNADYSAPAFHVGTDNDFQHWYAFITHEIGHNWFGDLIGPNIWLHDWLNEGPDVFINTFSMARRYPEVGDPHVWGDSLIERMERAILWADSSHSYMSLITMSMTNKRDFITNAFEWDGKIEGVSMGAPGQNAGFTVYMKPPAVLWLLRESVLGPAVFDSAFRTFIRRWSYKHPVPADLFRTIDDVSGRKLDWFWREFFYEHPKFDQAIESVQQRTSMDTTHVDVTYRNKARGVLPILAQLTFSDGTTQSVTYPAEVWKAGASYTVTYTCLKKKVTKITLDPDHHLVDINREDNTWTAKAP